MALLIRTCILQPALVTFCEKLPIDIFKFMSYCTKLLLVNIIKKGRASLASSTAVVWLKVLINCKFVAFVTFSMFIVLPIEYIKYLELASILHTVAVTPNFMAFRSVKDVSYEYMYIPVLNRKYILESLFIVLIRVPTSGSIGIII